MSEKSHLKEVFYAVTGKQVHEISFAVDSREVKTGDAFFALKGAKSDGHNFLKDAKEKGASSAFVREEYDGDSFGLNLYRVKEPFDVLEECAKEVIKRSNARIIGVTGSLGKTTTKDFITTLLRSKYKVASSKENQNSKIGLPMSILNEINGDEEYLVLEMGMTEPGHILKLLELAIPDIAIITQIAYVHAMNFSSIDEIAMAKAEILSHPKTKIGIIQHDVANFSYIASQGKSKKITYSKNSNNSDYHISIHQNIIVVEERGVKIEIEKPDFPAEHVFMNALGAIACARECKMSWDEIKTAFSKLTLPNKRLNKVIKDGVTFINDAYNAAEPSVKGALEYLSSFNSKKFAVLGNMLELGKFSEECHRRVGEHALKTTDELICLGPYCGPMVQVWQNAKREVTWYQNIEDVITHLQRRVASSDCVLLKGSRSLRMWEIIDKFSQVSG